MTQTGDRSELIQMGYPYSTVMTTNNGYDTILLVDSNDHVLSAWMATPETVESYVSTGEQGNEWEPGQFAGFTDPSGEDNEDELRTVAAYGTECGRNGLISDERRKAFWIREQYR